MIRYTFAYLADPAPWNAATHGVEDEKIFDLEVTHQEGDVAACTVTIKNPRVGILGPGRMRWAWIGYDDGTGAVPVFLGRVVALPQRVDADTISLMYTSRARDWKEQKEALAVTLRTAPEWEPIFYTPDQLADPDTVLVARPLAWHFDRETLEVSTSHFLEGEDGTIIFTGDDTFREEPQVTFAQPAASEIRLDLTARWSQVANGSVDISKNVMAAFCEARSTRDGNAATMTPIGFQQDWPDKGADVGGGWKVGRSLIARLATGNRWLVSKEVEAPTAAGSMLGATSKGLTTGRVRYDLPVGQFRFLLEMDYAASRDREELASIVVTANVQDLLADPGEDAIERIALTTANLSEPIADGTVPIGDRAARQFFPTDRGELAIRHGLAYATSRIIARSRAVNVRFAMPFKLGLALSLRKNAVLQHDRLAGGEVTGKIVSYRLALDGASGEAIAECVIGCAIGRGEPAAVPAVGVGAYAEVGYAEAGAYDAAIGTSVQVGPLVYSQDYKAVAPNDDGLNFHAMTRKNTVRVCEVNYGLGRQILWLRKVKFGDGCGPGLMPGTELGIEMVPVEGGPFKTDYVIAAEPVQLPKTIDMEAV